MKIGFKFPSGKFTWNALVSPRSLTEPLEACFLAVFKPVRT